MSAKSRAGKVAWSARAATYRKDLISRIADDSKAGMDAWTTSERIPIRVRIMARLAGRPLHLPAGESRP